MAICKKTIRSKMAVLFILPIWSEMTFFVKLILDGNLDLDAYADFQPTRFHWQKNIMFTTDQQNNVAIGR